MTAGIQAPASPILGSLASLSVRSMEFELAIDPPLPGRVLPASALRSIAGNHLFAADHDAFLRWFEPGKAEGSDKPPAFRMSGPMPGSREDGRYRFTATTWDAGGEFLEVLRGILHALERDRAHAYGVRITWCGPVREGRLADGAPDCPSRLTLALDSPLRLRKYVDPDPNRTDRSRAWVRDPAAVGLDDILQACLLRLRKVSATYAAGEDGGPPLHDLDVAACAPGQAEPRLVSRPAAALKTRNKRKANDLSGLVGSIHVLTPNPLQLALLVAGSVLGAGANTSEGCGSLSIHA